MRCRLHDARTQGGWRPDLLGGGVERTTHAVVRCRSAVLSECHEVSAAG